MTHYWQTVDGWFSDRVRPAFDHLLADLPADRPSTFVQVGTWVGRATAYAAVEILNSGKPVTLIAVDHFKGSAEIDGHRRAAQVPDSERAFRANLAPVATALGDRFELRVSDSAMAAEAFEDDSVDAVWIDASHAYRFVATDIYAWRGKVRPGGLLGGDDFTKCPGVAQAVTEQLGADAAVAGTVYWMVRRQADGTYRPEPR